AAAEGGVAAHGTVSESQCAALRVVNATAIAESCVAADRTIAKSQCAEISDAAAGAAACSSSIANRDSADVHDCSGANLQDSAVRAAILVAVDDRGRCSTAGDIKISSDNEFIN